MKEIYLTQGQIALVDDCDFERLNQWKWSAIWNSGTRSFYATRHSPSRNGRRYLIQMHRLIASALPGFEVDHRNHDTLDNRRKNLRMATTAQNQHNSRIHRDNTSGFKGVSFHKGKRSRAWEARIATNGRRVHLGTFSTKQEAHDAYVAAAHELHGEFAHA